MRILAIIGTGVVVLASQAYYAVTLTPYNHSLSTIIFGVLLPLMLGCLMLMITGQLVILLAFVGLFISVVDDIPVLLDWPRLTGFPPGVSHIEMQVWLYLLTGFLLLGSTTLALLRPLAGRKTVVLAYLLTLFALFLSFIDDLPLDVIDYYTNHAWYAFDLIQHLAAVAVLGTALVTVKKNISMSLSHESVLGTLRDKHS